MLKVSVFIDGKNYFNEKSFNEICEALEHGKTVQVDRMSMIMDLNVAHEQFNLDLNVCKRVK